MGSISVEEQAKLWGKVYQSESNPMKMVQFVQHQTVPLVEGVEKAVDTALSAFKGDKGVEDQTALRQLLIATAKHESLGGKYLEQKGGPARGAWQVEPSTARDILKTSGLIGEKAERILGKSKEEILQMPDQELARFLKDHNVNAVFATAKYLQGADAKNVLRSLA